MLNGDVILNCLPSLPLPNSSWLHNHGGTSAPIIKRSGNAYDTRNHRAVLLVRCNSRYPQCRLRHHMYEHDLFTKRHPIFVKTSASPEEKISRATAYPVVWSIVRCQRLLSTEASAALGASTRPKHDVQTLSCVFYWPSPHAAS